jgi:hypothetical protein
MHASCMEFSCGRIAVGTVTVHAQIPVDWVVMFGVVLEASPFLDRHVT